MRKIIHIALSVIDNLGDIGFACELMRAFEERFPDRYQWVIWTDASEKVRAFSEKNQDMIGPYELRSSNDFEIWEGSILFLLFHHPLPGHLPSHTLILRIDYLSLDPLWVYHTLSEHIHSTGSRRIIEIIPSPLTHGSGLIAPPSHFVSREALAEKYGLDAKKRWVSIFAYRDTRENHLIIEEIENTEIILLGADLSWRRDDKKYRVTSPPFLSQREFSSIVRESTWTIVRGEVSLISALQIGTPLLWDMYKERGGWYGEQAEQFLSFMNRESEYQKLFMRLNGREWNPLSTREIDAYFASYPWKKREAPKNLVEEMQKCIDKYQFFL